MSWPAFIIIVPVSACHHGSYAGRYSRYKQTTENQRFEILKYADAKKLPVDAWIEETISATKKLSHRKLGALLAAMQPEDILLVTELSRLGRSLLEVMSILHTLME